MKDDILSILSEKQNTFSKGQRRIAAYITESYDKAAFMTAAKLGDTVGVSESTVVRFASELGFDGYQKFQKSLRDFTIKKSTAFQRMEIASRQLDGDNVLNSVLKADIVRL